LHHQATQGTLPNTSVLPAVLGLPNLLISPLNPRVSIEKKTMLISKLWDLNLAVRDSTEQLSDGYTATQKMTLMWHAVTSTPSSTEFNNF